jgi:hypothetical protein
MTWIDYAACAIGRLGELLEQVRRNEADLQDRLEARLNNPGRAPQSLSDPDPVAKRLRFMLANVRARRQAVERELARRTPDTMPIAAT